MKLWQLAGIFWLVCLATFFFIAFLPEQAHQVGNYGNFIGTTVVLGCISFLVMLISLATPSKGSVQSVTKDKVNSVKAFEPKHAKNKNTKSSNPWIILCVCLLCIVFYLLLRSNGWFVPPLTRDECYRLGSNERTALCLKEVESRNPGPTPIILDGRTIEVATKSISGNNILTTLKNHSGHNVEDVLIKFTFYNEAPKSGIPCESLTPIDTKYWTFPGFLGSNDVRSESAYIPTTVRWGSYCVEVQGAKSLD